MAARRHPVDDLVDDRLNARAHVLDAARGESAYHQAAQAAMVGRILLQHPVAHAAIDRLVENLRPEAPAHAADEILAEALVAQDRSDVGMPAGDVEPDRREMHRIDCAQPVIDGIRVGDEFRRLRIEQRRALDGLDLLVHDDPRSMATDFCG